jgi:hypothetical protein
MFCITEQYNTKRTTFHELDNIMNYIDCFFILVESNEVIEAIWLEKIIRKCISIKIHSDEYALFCLETDDHD